MQITAKKISQKYKNLKKPKKTFLVNENELETVFYSNPEEQDHLFAGESIIAAANNVLDYEAFLKRTREIIKKQFKKQEKCENDSSKNITKIKKLKKSQENIFNWTRTQNHLVLK